MEHTTVWDADTLIDELITARLADLPAALRQPGSGLYLLVDPLLGDPVLPSALDEGLSTEDMDALRSEAWQRPTFALRLPPALSLDDALAPYLVELSGADDALLATSVQWAVQETVQTWHADAGGATPHRVGGWLQTVASGPELAAHLTQLLRLRTQQHTLAHYLRLADRRAWGLTLHVLGEDTVAAGLPPVQHWHWLDAHAAWRTLSAAPGQAQATPWPAFDAAQWAVMAQGPAIHAHMAQDMARSLAHTPPADPRSWPPVSAAQWHAACAQAAGRAAASPPHKTQEDPA